MNVVGRIGLAMYLLILTFMLAHIILGLGVMVAPLGEFFVKLLLTLAMPTAFIVIGGKD